MRGVASERYPINGICAHPSCTEPTADPHHCWPRSAIGNDSWFVEFVEPLIGDRRVMPHVAGLCRAHHDDVEEHRAWIRMEGNDTFVWYDRDELGRVADPEYDGWVIVGPLNPQPGSREGKPKRRPFKGEQRRQRLTITLRVPKDSEEDGAGLLDDLHRQVEERLGHERPRPIYYSIIDSFVFLLGNADETDV